MAAKLVVVFAVFAVFATLACAGTVPDAKSKVAGPFGLDSSQFGGSFSNGQSTPNFPMPNFNGMNGMNGMNGQVPSFNMQSLLAQIPQQMRENMRQFVQQLANQLNMIINRMNQGMNQNQTPYNQMPYNNYYDASNAQPFGRNSNTPSSQEFSFPPNRNANSNSNSRPNRGPVSPF